MATAIINSQMDAINESFSNISSDLTTIRPLLKNATIGAYPTDTASGSIASFTDGAEGIPVKSLSVDLEPVQDLNGYDNPWPAGGGKNILPHSGSTTTTNGITFTMNADGTVTANGTATEDAVFTYNNSDFATPPAAGTYYINGNPTGASSTTYRMRTRRYVNGSWASWVYYNDTSNQTLAFVDGTTRIRVEINVMSGQTVSNLVFSPMLRSTSYTDASYAPYENICPISGHTEVNVYRTGKNLLNFLNSRTSSGITFTYDETTGAMSVSGTATTNAYSDGSASISTASKYVYLPKGTYYVSLNGTLNANNFPRYYIQQVTKDGAATLVLAGYSNASFELTADAYVYFRIQVGSDETVNTTLYPQIAKAQSDFEAPQSTTYNLPLGQTVYGGTLDVVSGVLTITHKHIKVSDMNWSYNSGFASFRTANNDFDGLTPSEGQASGQAFCSAYVISNPQTTAQMAAATYSIAIGAGISVYRILINDPTYNGDVTAFIAAMGDTDIVYELATPTTVQLTATQVSTLLGANNIFADAGEVSVVYRADTGLYIDKKLAQALNA